MMLVLIQAMLLVLMQAMLLVLMLLLLLWRIAMQQLLEIQPCCVASCVASVDAIDELMLMQALL